VQLTILLKKPLCLRTILIRTIVPPYWSDVGEHGSGRFGISEYSYISCDLGDVLIIWIEDMVVRYLTNNITEK